MQIALNGATTLRGSLEQDIDAAVTCGYQGLEIWLPKLNAYLEHGTLLDLKERLANSGLRMLTLNSLERFNLNDPAGHERMLVDAERLCRLSAALGVERVVVVPSPRPTGMSDEAVLERSARDLRDLLALADRFQVGLAVEFLGFGDCSINTLGEALKLIRLVNHGRLGVVVDTFHFYAGASRLEDLADLRPGELTIFHINDCEAGDRSTLTDDRRLYPGLGVIPLQAMLTALRTSGYDGFCSIEIFRPEYWDQPVIDVAQRALATTRLVLAG